MDQEAESQRRIQELESDQHEALEQISQGLDRLQNIGNSMREEINNQNTLVDGITTNVEQAQRDVKGVERKASKLKHQGGGCTVS